MEIKYDGSKSVKCYSDYVLHPEDRKAVKSFCRIFGSELLSAAKKLHERLINFRTVGDYNAMFGQTDNRIEIKKGDKDTEELVMKVRVTLSYRKFFNGLCEDEGRLLVGDLKENNRRLCEVGTIFVFDVNNHKYEKV